MGVFATLVMFVCALVYKCGIIFIYCWCELLVRCIGVVTGYVYILHMVIYNHFPFIKVFPLSLSPFYIHFDKYTLLTATFHWHSPHISILSSPSYLASVYCCCSSGDGDGDVFMAEQGNFHANTKFI